MSELAADGVPVTVTCRVLKFARQPYYQWLASPVTRRDWVRAYRMTALVDAHRDDPEFGYRYLTDEARQGGWLMADRTAGALCSPQHLWSTFGKRQRGKAKKPGPPVHDDLVQRDFTATRPNQLWLTDMTAHPTAWIPVIVATPRFRRCRMGVVERQRKVREYRGQIPSPGRPTVAWREDRVRFWAAIIVWIEPTYRRRRQAALGPLTPSNTRPS